MSETAEPRPNLFTQSTEGLRNLVGLVDTNLELVRDLHPDASSCRTLLVDQNGTHRILKVRQLTTNVWDDTYFHYEIHALRRVDERKLTGVTHLVDYYKTDYYEAILKTYAEGTPCNQLDNDDYLYDFDFIRKLDELYRKLHLAGIAKIHFLPRKVVIGENGELTLVDLSTCVVNTEIGVQRFSQAMREDSRFINELERKARRRHRQRTTTQAEHA